MSRIDNEAALLYNIIMRRKDRQRDEKFALEIADKCEWAVLSVVNPEGLPYSVPLSIARNGNELYFHAAKEGLKTECLNRNPNVCVVCVGDTERRADKFTTKYESAVIRGKAAQITDDKAKIEALGFICRRHAESNMAEFDDYARRYLDRTAVWKITIEEITGKCNE